MAITVSHSAVKEKRDVPKRERLGSQWDGLNTNLLATFFEVEKVGSEYKRKEGLYVVAPLTDASCELTQNWTSPFEQSGVDQSAPYLTAMLQTGGLSQVVDAVGSALGFEGDGGMANEALKQAQGRSSVTKLNSTQIFSGMPPVKFSVTALFRAWSNARDEVERPMEKLVEWSLPKAIVNEGTLIERGVQIQKGSADWWSAIMPSKAPCLVGMTYKGRTWMPMVIESISIPIASNVTGSGEFVELAIPMTLATLTAIDAKDWATTSVNHGR